ncbi:MULTISPECIES: hypothetical protein [Halobacterium]|uniref:hypothetical protein n=1 Tax=Halobacterium TaxID=2239 RepID=UPI00073F3506|nr:MULTISPECIES: hypothetical protein [Halobacterium]MCG1004668.1 hypothetical protein [Halobacterium noricense]
MTTDEPTPEGYDDRLSLLTKTIEALRETLERDHSLPTDQRMFACRLLFLASQPITEAERILPEPDRDVDSAEDLTLASWDDYAAAVINIERQLCWLVRSLRAVQPAAHHYDETPAEKFTTALEYATALRDILPAVPEDSPVLAIVFSLASSTRRRRLATTIPLLLARRG